jgi:hypothetical protein
MTTRTPGYANCAAFTVALGGDPDTAWHLAELQDSRQAWEAAALALYSSLRDEFIKASTERDDLRAALSSLTDCAEASQAITEDEADEYRKLVAEAPRHHDDGGPADPGKILNLVIQGDNETARELLSGFSDESLWHLTNAGHALVALIARARTEAQS